jgi:L-fuculose-phosphate aldolase
VSDHAGEPGSETVLRDAVVRVCRRLWERGLVAGHDGNVSVRLGHERILVTPAGLSKCDIGPEDLVVLTVGGVPIGGGLRPSSEIALHVRAYEKRPDVSAVVHAHPPFATAFGVTGRSLPDNVLPEVTVLLGPVPLVPYATPGSAELARRFDPFWAGHDAFLMANHGALALGSNLHIAHQRMETMEHAARIVATAQALGRVEVLTQDDVHVLAAMRAARTANE